MQKVKRAVRLVLEVGWFLFAVVCRMDIFCLNRDSFDFRIYRI